ncbi:MAG TPA: hypothetical protein VLT15_12855 [Acidimicrobiia bacterium]|nr:hypothetical protein [Acidimicrobiia bacterium]
MPALRTEITEIVTGLGMFGYPNLGHAIGMRPPAFENVEGDVYDRLASAYQSGLHRDLFDTAWRNGVRFAAANEGLRGRPPWIVEWKGAHRPPGYEEIPADLRVDHVYLVSCKYGSNILTNSSPTGLFGTESGEDDWFATVAPSAYQRLYDECRRLVPDPSLPALATGLTKSHRLVLKRTLPRNLAGNAKGAYREFATAAASGSSARWQESLGTKLLREQMVWRLLRLQSAPYFVLGESADGHALAYRVQTPWDLRASHEFLSFRQWGEADRGQPIVSWEAIYLDRRTGAESPIAGHIEVRWSHGKFAQAPEAKVYLDTPHHAVPAYLPLEGRAGGELSLFD